MKFTRFISIFFILMVLLSTCVYAENHKFTDTKSGLVFEVPTEWFLTIDNETKDISMDHDGELATIVFESVFKNSTYTTENKQLISKTYNVEEKNIKIIKINGRQWYSYTLNYGMDVSAVSTFYNGYIVSFNFYFYNFETNKYYNDFLTLLNTVEFPVSNTNIKPQKVIYWSIISFFLGIFVSVTFVLIKKKIKNIIRANYLKRYGNYEPKTTICVDFKKMQQSSGENNETY